MLPTPTRVELQPETRESLKIFLESGQGQNFLQALSACCPSILREGTMENQLASAQRHSGFEECLETILAFIQPLPPEEGEVSTMNYPDLDKDEAWTEEKMTVST